MLGVLLLRCGSVAAWFGCFVLVLGPSHFQKDLPLFCDSLLDPGISCFDLVIPKKSVADAHQQHEKETCYHGSRCTARLSLIHI